MRIAILGTRGIPAKYGGFETFAEELSVRLVKRGMDVTVYAERDSAAEAGADMYHGVKIAYVRCVNLGPLRTIIYDLACILKSLRGYDLIYMLGYGGGMFFVIPRLFGKKIWVNMDGMEWRRSKWPWYGKIYLKTNEWLAARLANTMIADAQGIYDYLEQEYGGGIRCHVVAYGGAIVEDQPDKNVLSAYGLDESGYYLVVCRLEPENHVTEIVNGFANSATARKLVIVGDHATGTEYVNRLLSMRDERIKYLGAIYDKEALKAVRYYSHAYFHGHSVGGTNPSLLEALGCGNRIIAHDNVFNREVADDCAVYFRSSDDIPGIIADCERQNDMAHAARAKERVRQRYNWESIADRYDELFRGQG